MSADPSASYAVEVANLLWPAADAGAAPYLARSRRQPAPGVRDAYVFPSTRSPRLLVPADVPAAASMLRRLGSGRSRLAGPARAALERAVRTRAFSLSRWPVLRVPDRGAGADSIETHLSTCFDTDVRVGVLLGTRRVNQKPVLQVFGVDGRLLGFAKVGHNPLTAELVRREARSLAAVEARRPTTFVIPEVLHHGQWAGLEVLVMSALTTDPQLPVTRAMREAAMREVAGLTATEATELAGSSFWTRLRAEAGRLAAEPQVQAQGQRLVAAGDALEQAHGNDPVRLGGWHGDWGHWNMGLGDGALKVLKVWDWERFDPEVPIGFDALHYAAQAVRPGQREEASQQETFLRSVPATLSALGVSPEDHQLTLRLYLLEIATRYVDALTHGATPALTRRTEWVLGLLEHHGEPAHHALVEGRS